MKEAVVTAARCGPSPSSYYLGLVNRDDHRYDCLNDETAMLEAHPSFAVTVLESMELSADRMMLVSVLCVYEYTKPDRFRCFMSVIFLLVCHFAR